MATFVEADVMRGFVVVECLPEVEAKLVAMRAEYEELLHGDGWSLQRLFSTPDFDIAAFCADFRPNRFAAVALAETESFCRRYGIWLESTGTHYNSMTPYLHPNTISPERMTTIGIYNAILFWLNDTVGREKFANLTTVDQQRATRTLRRLSALLETRSAAADPDPVELASAEFLTLLADSADAAWLDEFLESTRAHLNTAIRDQNARARGGVLGVTEYIDLRGDVSGMYPAIALCEFGRDEYLRWDRIRAAGLGEPLARLRRLTADIGALMNDLFSFEKECIRDGADFNLVSVWLLNTPGARLADAVEAAAGIVRDRLLEFVMLRDRIGALCDALPERDVAVMVGTQVEDMSGCVRATWVWQLTTLRYKGASIFVENRMT
ncbi:terpene synthase family protein [Nocardia aurea]|uniref:Terpene synthase family protein n=1 Tax=Nocardia aurea TaxID=2144174 RepID=A0ABV3FX53_9NOCA